MKKIFTIFILLSLFGLSNYVDSQTLSADVQPISAIPVVGINPIVSYKTINNKIYLIGLQHPPFDNSIYNLSNQIRTYDLVTNTWDTLSLHLPYGIFDITTASYYNNHFYYAPGYSSGGSGGFGSHNKMIDVDITNSTAQETTHQFSGGSIWNISSLEANGKIYFFGGWNGSAVNTIFEYNPSLNTFQQVASFSYARSYVRAILGNDGWIYVLSHQNTIERFNPLTYQVQTMSATIPANMIINYWHISQDASIYFFNGNGGTVNPSIYKYNYSSDILTNTGIILNGTFSTGSIMDNDPNKIYGFKYNPDMNAPLQLVKLSLNFNISATISIPDTITKITQAINIPIKTTALNTSSNVIAYQFDLAYNPSKLQYVNKNLTGTIALGGTVTINSSTPGLLHVSYMNSTPISGTGSILNLQFNPLTIGSSPLTITNFLYNTDTIHNVTNGIVTAIGKYGDIDTNNFVQAYDAALALQYSVGLDPLPLSDPRPWENWRKIVANVDNTDSISANDASLILQFSAGLITTFPVGGNKSSSNPIADITITQDNNELVFTSTGDFYGLNIYANNGSTVIMNTPIVSDPNMLSATNIIGNTYNIGLCTAYPPNDNTEIMRIPFTCTDAETLTFNMIINKNSAIKTFNVNCSVGIIENTQNLIHIYPNPAKDKIEIEGIQKGIVEVINIQGQTIKTVNISSIKTIVKISDISNGIYTLKIKSDEGVVLKKLIKQ